MTHELTLARDDFAEILTIATMGVRGAKSGFSVRLDFADGELTATGPGAAGTAPASGQWPGAVLIDGALAWHLSSRLPTPDPFTLAAADGRLIMGGFSMAACLMDVAPKAVDLVLGAGYRDVLVAVERHGESKVVASVGASAIALARAASSRAVATATRALKGFGVTRAEIDQALLAALRRQASS
ncbi:MAG: hypothetical protein ABI306_11610 [Caulobacteraceae bacterium]